MIRKALTLSLAAIMTASIAAGCGTAATTTATTASAATSASASAETSAASAEATTAAASGEKTKIKLALWDYENSTYDKAMIEKFIASQDKVDVEVVSSPNADYDNKLAVMLGGGDEIDAFYGKSNTQYPTLVLHNNMLKLDDLIARDSVDLTPYGTVLEQHYRINGGLYALPYRTNDWVVFYNKDIFDAAGVAYPTNDMTWEKYREIAKSVTSGEGADKTYGAAFIPKAGFIVPTLVSKDPAFDLMSSSFDSFKYPLQFVLDLQNTDKSYEPYADSKSMNQDQTYFYKGKTAMLYNGSWFTQMLIKDADKVGFKWGIAKSPYWEGNEQTGFATSTPVCISATTKNTDAAWELVKFLTGAEGAKTMASYNMVPAYMTDEVMAAYKESTKLDEDSFAALTGNKTYALGASNQLMGLVSSMINEEVELVVTGNESIDDAVANMTSRRQEIIDQNK